MFLLLPPAFRLFLFIALCFIESNFLEVHSYRKVLQEQFITFSSSIYSVLEDSLGIMVFVVQSAALIQRQDIRKDMIIRDILAQNKSLRAEVEFLKEISNATFLDSSSYTHINAVPISDKTYNVSFGIQRGLVHGIDIGHVVFEKSGFVGWVYEVSDKASKIVPFRHSSLTLPVRVGEKTRAILHGQQGFDPLIKNFDDTVQFNIQEGDPVKILGNIGVKTAQGQDVLIGYAYQDLLGRWRVSLESYITAGSRVPLFVLTKVKDKKEK